MFDRVLIHFCIDFFSQNYCLFVYWIWYLINILHHTIQYKSSNTILCTVKSTWPYVQHYLLDNESYNSISYGNTTGSMNMDIWVFGILNHLQFFEKGFHFPENLFQSWSIENVQNFISKKSRSLKRRAYFKILHLCSFCWLQNETSNKKYFCKKVLRQKGTQIPIKPVDKGNCSFLPWIWWIIFL